MFKVWVLALTLFALPAYAGPSCAGGTIALTFDDGPVPGKTDRILNLLHEARVHATFFLVGLNTSQHPELAKRIVKEGHEVGNHTWRHEDLTGPVSLSTIDDTQREIIAATGKRPQWMRPPYGNTNTAIRAYVASIGLTEVLWTTDSHDWDGYSPAKILALVKLTQSGGIVLLHDHGEHTIEALPGILAFFRDNNICAGRLSNTMERVPFWTDDRAFFVKAVR